MKPALALVLSIVIGCGCAANVDEQPDASTPGPEVADAAPEPPEAIFPDPDWAEGDPAEHGLDPAKLDEAAAIAAGNGSECLLVFRHGVMVYERYFAGTDAATIHQSWSLAKSYSSTLVGIAVDRGDLSSLDDQVASYVPEWQGTPRDVITVRDLVSMTSGLEWSAFQDYVSMAVFSADNTAFALGLALAEAPGTSWTYHNGAVQMLEPLFRAATGASIEAYAEQHLWSRIGMHATWEHDDAGHPTPYANVLATCRDHARLGYLYLQGGRWGSEQVLSPGWVAQALTPSQDHNRAYGFLFWLNSGTPALDAMMQAWPDRMVPFAPPDLFAARGFGNQFVDVIPSLDLMVVRFGENPASSFDLAAFMDDARFTKHDDILRPVLDAIRPSR